MTGCRIAVVTGVGIGRAVVLALALAGSAAAAEDATSWPTRAITLVVPFSAGGPVDTVARIVTARMSELLHQQIVVENQGGAGGMIGSARVAKAAPDGYTVLLSGSAVLAMNQSLYLKPLYNSATDFEQVTLFADAARVLIARKDFPADTLPQFIDYVRAHQSTLRYGSAGVGSGTHVCVVLLNMAMGASVTHVPYRGSGPAMQDLVGGRIDFIAEQIATALPHIRNGTVKAIATLGLTRAPGLENLPTADEQGLKNLNCGAWISFSYPKGTPAAIVHKLAEATSEAVDTPAVRERLEHLGVVVTPPERRTPEYLTKFVVSETARWAAPIKASGLSVK